LAYNNLLLSLFSNKHHEILHWVAPQRGIPEISISLICSTRANFKNTPKEEEELRKRNVNILG
jgi:hypothetical protein